jgi:hypothetical protein
MTIVRRTFAWAAMVIMVALFGVAESIDASNFGHRHLKGAKKASLSKAHKSVGSKAPKTKAAHTMRVLKGSKAHKHIGSKAPKTKAVHTMRVLKGSKAHKSTGSKAPKARAVHNMRDLKGSKAPKGYTSKVIKSHPTLKCGPKRLLDSAKTIRNGDFITEGDNRKLKGVKAHSSKALKGTKAPKGVRVRS